MKIYKKTDMKSKEMKTEKLKEEKCWDELHEMDFYRTIEEYNKAAETKKERNSVEEYMNEEEESLNYTRIKRTTANTRFSNFMF